MQLQLSIIALLSSAVYAAYLPSSSTEAYAATRGRSFWAKVDDRVFYPPPASLLALSQNVSDYYYVMGSKSALTTKMKEHVVGSKGRYHIMHLPQGPSMLELSATSHIGDRRQALSHFTQLKSGTVLTTGFPDYQLKSNYRYPADAATQHLEKAAVSLINEDSAMHYLRKLVGGFPTRSYSNLDQSEKVENFLKNEFEALGIHSCYHTFNSESGTLTNVIGHIPGTASRGGVIVGAHYDSRPFTGKAPGAEDNGSGVAALYAIAKAYMAKKIQPKKDVYFVAFAGEEPGLIGSKNFAEALSGDALPSECTSASSSFLQTQPNKRKLLSGGNKKRQMAKFKAADYSAIIMDEIGWKSPKLSRPTVNLESFDEEGAFVMDHLRAASEMHNGDNIEVVHNGHPFGSDHMSFLDRGMSSVLTINGDDEAYPNYHQSSDTLEGKGNIDPGLLSMVTKMNLGALIRISMS